ncbi:MAG: bacteriocin [Lachnospiraceae bacterium]|nr:bacteriocin [Lachnospiraceae bacterium]
MSKSKEELEELKKEVEDFDKKVQKLTEEELAQVTGGGIANEPFPGSMLSPDPKY